ncbi:hypothetical protein K502DRAFT_340508 [Neoconidiobolus thromboides FSU 785]|nr:hypothetical protein K502DRAFT_340508 [Neoconidiobolus thromboides FSU 785]
MFDYRVILITGVEGKVGQGILHRVIEEYNRCKIIVTCENVIVANELFNQYYQPKKGKNIIFKAIEIDLNCIQSVLNFINCVKEETQTIDLLFFNAGKINCNGINNWKLIYQLSTNFNGLFVYPEYINFITKLNKNNINQCFMINILSHYIIFLKLMSLFNKNQVKIIWTGSNQANKYHFNINDIQANSSINPYASNKFAIQLLNNYINEKYIKNNIHSYVFHPGIVPSNLLATLFPSFILIYIIPIFMFILKLLFHLDHFTLYSSNATAPLSFIFKNNNLLENTRLDASTDNWNNNIIELVNIGHKEEEGNKLQELFMYKLNQLVEKMLE